MTDKTTPIKKQKDKPVTPETRETPNLVSTSKDFDFNVMLASQAVGSFLRSEDKEVEEIQLKGIVGALSGIAPQDAIEGMLSVQMLAVHNASMECFRRAMFVEQNLENREQNLNFANKFTRSYALLVDSLQKYRGKGVSEQKVTVQHVHVSEGGQAIVGNVERK